MSEVRKSPKKSGASARVKKDPKFLTEEDPRHVSWEATCKALESFPNYTEILPEISCLTQNEQWFLQKSALAYMTQQQREYGDEATRSSIRTLEQYHLRKWIEAHPPQTLASIAGHPTEERRRGLRESVELWSIASAIDPEMRDAMTSYLLQGAARGVRMVTDEEYHEAVAANLSDTNKFLQGAIEKTMETALSEAGLMEKIPVEMRDSRQNYLTLIKHRYIRRFEILKQQ